MAPSAHNLVKTNQYRQEQRWPDRCTLRRRGISAFSKSKLSREAALTGEFLVSGAEDSFTAHFSTFTPQLLAFYRARGCEATLAEDLAQEVMLKVYLRARQLRDRSRFRAWLFRIARNTLARHHAKRTREVETFDIQDGIERVPASKAEPAGAPFEFMSWMERLETREREIMMLRFIEDWEYHEIAAAKSIPIGTVGGASSMQRRS